MRIPIIISILTFAVLIAIAGNHSYWIVAGIVLLALLYVGIEIAIYNDKQWSVAITDSIQNHRSTLAGKRRLLRFENEYGVLETQKWEDEKLRFFNDIVVPKVNLLMPDKTTDDEINHAYEKASEMIDSALDEILQDNKHEKIEDMKGEEYEEYCARAFEKHGAKVERTSITGDFGADLLVRIDGKLLVVQCKRSNKPVGNKAVQEVASAKTVYDADCAAVVSNAGYTQAAHQTAASHGITVIMDEEIDSVVERVKTQKGGRLEKFNRSESVNSLRTNAVSSSVYKSDQVRDECVLADTDYAEQRGAEEELWNVELSKESIADSGTLEFVSRWRASTLEDDLAPLRGLIQSAVGRIEEMGDACKDQGYISIELYESGMETLSSIDRTIYGTAVLSFLSVLKHADSSDLQSLVDHSLTHWWYRDRDFPIGKSEVEEFLLDLQEIDNTRPTLFTGEIGLRGFFLEGVWKPIFEPELNRWHGTKRELLALIKSLPVR